MGFETLHYRYPSARRTVTARFAAPELSSVLKSFYPSYRCHEPAPDGSRITLERENGSYRLIGPTGTWYADDAGEAVALYEGELTAAFLREINAEVRLHGAAVCTGDTCLVLIGHSGAGKSTLTLGLLVSGLQPLADDVVVIDPKSGRIQPFERSIRVHRTGVARLGVEPERIRGARLCEPYVWVGLDWMGPDRRRARPPGAIVFLEPEDRRGAERLSASETLGRLLVGRTGLCPAARAFHCLAGLAEEVPSYLLRYSDFREALEPLTEIARSNGRVAASLRI